MSERVAFSRVAVSFTFTEGEEVVEKMKLEQSREESGQQTGH